jgi:hypothetical protein
LILVFGLDRLNHSIRDPNMKNTSELWFQTGLITSTKDCRRYIPVHELCKSLSSVVCEILPADHARSIWHRFDLPFGSYSPDISFWLRSTESFYSRQITKLIGWLFQSFEHRVLPYTKERGGYPHNFACTVF